MIAWLSANIGTVAVSAVLAAAVIAIICVLIKNKRKGKSSCGCNCSTCPMGGSCHNK